jgi:mercuric ion transport protein
MNNDKMLKTGLIGTGVAIICCFTPLLVVLFAAAGVTAWLAWADYVLWPALAGFVLLTAVAFARRNKSPEPE